MNHPDPLETSTLSTSTLSPLRASTVVQTRASIHSFNTSAPLSLHASRATRLPPSRTSRPRLPPDSPATTMSDAELDLSDFDDELELDSDQDFDQEDEEMALSSPLASEQDHGDEIAGSDSGFSPFGSSTPVSNSYAGFKGKGKGKGRASLSSEEMYGQVDYRPLSLGEIEAEQRQGIEYVEDMLKLKVSSVVP